MTGEKRKRITKKFKQEQLEKIYSFGLDGVLGEVDKSQFEKESHSFYNEVLREGVDFLAQTLSKAMGKNAVFYDLGCGSGKMIMHLAIETKMSKIVGIELSKERFERALEIAAEVEFPNTQPAIINDDFRNVDLSDATIVYFDNNGYTLEETEQVMGLLPKGCLIVYQNHGFVSGDRFFRLPTLHGIQDEENQLVKFWNERVSYRYL